MAKSIENQRPNIVLGQVSDKNNRPLPNLIVQVYNLDLRSEKLLAETITEPLPLSMLPEEQAPMFIPLTQEQHLSVQINSPISCQELLMLL